MDEAEKPRPRRAIPEGESKWQAVGDDFSTIFRSGHQDSPVRAMDDDDTAVRSAVRDGERPDPRAAFAAADASTSTSTKADDYEAGPEDSQPKPTQDRRGWGPVALSALLTLSSIILPGAGMLAARSRTAKLIGGGVALAFVAGMIWLVSQVRGGIGSLSKFLRPEDLGKVIAGLVIVGLVWVAVIAGTQLLTRPRGLRWQKRMVGAITVAVSSLVVAAPLALAARYTFDTQKLVTTVFPQGDKVKTTTRPTIDANQKNPWDGHPRLNILLVGADSNAARIVRDPNYYSLDSVRTDTMMVASINTATGATTIVQLPRNLLRTPFPAGSPMANLYPDGFRSGRGEDADWLTELWSKARNPEYPEIGKIFEGNTYPGAELLKQGVEGITGLRMDYFVLLNTDGLQRLIEAMGGVTVNINEQLPRGKVERCGSWNLEECLQPGPNQRLGGYDAMWYARSRKNTSDYARMARQSCLVNAIIKQANPATMLTSYEAIASASADMVVTDIPQEVVEPVVALSGKVKDAKVSRLVFAPGRNGYKYKYPNFTEMRSAVAKAVAADSTIPSTSPLPTATGSTKPSTKPTATASTTQIVDGSQGVTDACAYNPVQ